MKRKFYGASLLLLLTVLLFSSSLARAQDGGGGKRDHLTPEEVELVRMAQIIDVRMAVFIKAAERRILVLTDPDAVNSRQVQKDMRKWGDLPRGTRTELLTDIAKILDEAATNIDDLAARDPKNELLPKALQTLASASTRFLGALKPMRSQAAGAEREALEQAIENAQLIVEAADRLPEDTKGKEKGKN
jgi:hypothetical protein